MNTCEYRKKAPQTESTYPLLSKISLPEAAVIEILDAVYPEAATRLDA